MKRCDDAGANSDTQWYWPPEVGALLGRVSATLSQDAASGLSENTYMDAISAMDANTSM